MVPVSYLSWLTVDWSVGVSRARCWDTHPYNTPPNATNRPMMMAGAAEPATSSGFFNMMAIFCA